MRIESRDNGNILSPLVSIIVPTYNSARTLRLCMGSLRRQTYRHFELIVVDNYSEDDTVSIARDFGATILYGGRERSEQKNNGARHACGEFLYFVDSDFVLERDVIFKCVEACRFFDAVCTVNYSLGKGLWGKSIALKEYFLAHDPTIQVARFIRRKAFFEVGCFDEKLVVGEDLDLYARLLECGYKVGRVNAVEWHIGEPQTLRDVARRNFYYGKNVLAYFGKRGKLAVKQLSPFKPSLFFKIVRSGSPFIFSLAVVDMVRWMSSLAGMLCSINLSEKRTFKMERDFR
ncbi:MAG: glycosyltransferase [Candidatus Bathyarchaeia archaeon]